MQSETFFGPQIFFFFLKIMKQLNSSDWIWNKTRKNKKNTNGGYLKQVLENTGQYWSARKEVSKQAKASVRSSA